MIGLEVLHAVGMIFHEVISQSVVIFVREGVSILVQKCVKKEIGNCCLKSDSR